MISEADDTFGIKAKVFPGGNYQRMSDVLREVADWLEENPKIRLWDIVPCLDKDNEVSATVYFRGGAK